MLSNKYTDKVNMLTFISLLTSADSGMSDSLDYVNTVRSHDITFDPSGPTQKESVYEAICFCLGGHL